MLLVQPWPLPVMKLLRSFQELGSLLLLALDHGGAFAVALAAGELHALLVHRRGMAERHVIAVEHVLDLELPVAVVDVAVLAHVERELAAGCAVDHVVDVALDRADVVLEARALLGEACENEAAILADTRRAREAEGRLVEIGRAAFLDRHGREPPVGVETPAVVAAGETRGVALALVHHLGAAMGAAIEQHVHGVVAMTGHDDRLAAEVGGDEVAGIWHLAGMADEQPRAREDAFHLQLEHVGIGVDAAMHAAGFNQGGDVVGVSVVHGDSRLCCSAALRHLPRVESPSRKRGSI